MNETRLTEALLLESTPPYWVLIIAAAGVLIMVPGILHYFGRRPGGSRGRPLTFLIAGGFFVLFPPVFLLAHENIALEINRPAGGITIRDDDSRVELPAADFHSLYIAEVREEKDLDYRLYLRRPGGRNFFIDEYDTVEQALRTADPISAMIGLPIQKSGDKDRPRPVAANLIAPAGTAGLPAERRSTPETTAKTTSESLRLRMLETEHGTVYYWELRQYWLILPVIAWAGILYLLFFVLPGRRGWSPVLILFQAVFSAIFVALLLALPLGLLGKQCVLPGETRLYAWQDVGGYSLRRASIRYDRVEFFQHVMNDTADPFLTLVAAKDVDRIQDLTRETGDVLRKSETLPDIRVGGVNPFVIPLYIDLLKSFGDFRLFRMIQLDLRGLSVAEQKRIEDAVFERLPPARRTAATDPDYLARKMQEAFFQQF